MKKNFRKIPEYVLAKASEFNSIQVVAIKKVTETDLKNGKFSHLGITFVGNELSIPQAVLPPESSGKYSKRNINGEIIIRKDLPKEEYTIQIESPNWGGTETHTIYWTKERYQRESKAPHLTSILICSDRIEEDGSYLLTFRLDEVIKSNATNFNADLLRCINLMQENVGCVDVISSETSLQDYLSSLVVGWELLPPGTKEAAYAYIFKGSNPTTQQKEQFEERYSFLKSLNPIQEVRGSSGLNRYLGGKIKDNLIVFENFSYGNAIYIMYEDWEKLSKLSRIDLLSGKLGHSFDRVPHINKWKEKVLKIIEAHK